MSAMSTSPNSVFATYVGDLDVLKAIVAIQNLQFSDPELAVREGYQFVQRPLNLLHRWNCKNLDRKSTRLNSSHW